MNLFPDIPTAHGFCMYIKREAIDDLGLFDEETFGKGYGEENDFSYRCLQAMDIDIYYVITHIFIIKEPNLSLKEKDQFDKLSSTNIKREIPSMLCKHRSFCSTKSDLRDTTECAL